jgi:putative transposase
LGMLGGHSRRVPLMPRKRRQAKPLATIWEVNDELWSRIEPVLRADWKPSPKGGQPPADWRRIFNGVIHRPRSGCQWNHLPKRFGDDSTVHRWFQRWCRHGVMERIWASLVGGCAELGEVCWEWQSADGCMGKARFGGEKGRHESHRSRQTRHQEESARR